MRFCIYVFCFCCLPVTLYAEVFTPPIISAEILYRHRFLFSQDGEPLIPVRITENQVSIDIEVHGAAQLRLPDHTLRYLKEGDRISIQQLEGQQASTATYWLLESFRLGERERVEQRKLYWESRGYPVEQKTVGALYGFGQRELFDNRFVYLLSKVLPKNKDVAIEKIIWNTQTPRFRYLVSIGNTKYEYDDVVQFRASEAVLSYHDRFAKKAHRFQLSHDLIVVGDRYGKLALVNVLPESILIAGIIPSEIFSNAPLQSLKAQAVAARGELFAKVGRRHFADPYLICAKEHCQVYKGRGLENAATQQAARETKGEFLFDDHMQLIDAVYSSSCGGHTAAAHHVWERPEHPSLQGVFDMPTEHALRYDVQTEDGVRQHLTYESKTAFCAQTTFPGAQKVWRWHRRFSQTQLQKLFPKLGEIQNIVVRERGQGGRVRTLEIIGQKSSELIHRELPIRRRFATLRSAFFALEQHRKQNQELTEIEFHGAGFGHGAGMCQYGAVGMGELGYGYQNILSHYYQSSRLLKVY